MKTSTEKKNKKKTWKTPELALISQDNISAGKAQKFHRESTLAPKMTPAHNKFKSGFYGNQPINDAFSGANFNSYVS